MFLKRAMRYYRVWIYSCNLALFISTLVFIILGLWIASDFHLALFPSITFYQPSFIYAYMALTLQSGILQAIGCMGANRMNERLLGLYWQILLVLLIGDIVVGIIWLFRYNLLLTNLRSDLIYRLDNDYGFDTDFQELWDRVQSEHQCCGIDAPYDYNMTQWFEREHATYEGAPFLVPQSCCAYHRLPTLETTHISSRSIATELRSGGDGNTVEPSSTSVGGGGGVVGSSVGSVDESGPGRPGSDDSLISSQTTSADCMDSYKPESIYTTGCYNQILGWLQSSVDCLSVIGFCVITFLKLCFAFILRYEIKEMIQKIKLIKGENAEAASNAVSALHNLEAYLPRPSIQNDSNQALLSNQSPNSQQSNNTANNNNSKNNSTNNKRNHLNTNPSCNNSFGSCTGFGHCSDGPNAPCGSCQMTINITQRDLNQQSSTGQQQPLTTPSKTINRNQQILSSSTSVPFSTTATSPTTSNTAKLTDTVTLITTATSTATVSTATATSIGTESMIKSCLSLSLTSPTNNAGLIGLAGIKSSSLGDKSSPTANKSFNANTNNNNQVVVTNF